MVLGFMVLGFMVLGVICMNHIYVCGKRRGKREHYESI